MPQRLLVPLFQRPYVWNRESQWEPLWRDIERVANRLLVPATVTQQPHFLGAVVLQQLPNPSGAFQVRTIIDGQQRLTTLQIVLDAFQAELVRVGADRPAGRLLKLVENDSDYCDHEEDQFKVWPTNRDRRAFEEVMAAPTPVDYSSLELKSERLPQAHEYFAIQAAEWLQAEGADTVQDRAEALERTVRELLQLVVIDLASDENAQEIFETLNSRGAQLSAADLIKNFVFQRLLEEGANTESAYDLYWKHFETAFWEQDVSVGRLTYPRSSQFLNTFLVSRLGEPVAAQEVFQRFKTYALHDSGVSMLELLQQVHRASKAYEGYILGASNSDSDVTRLQMFAYRMQAVDVDVVKALILTLLDPEQDPLPAAQLDRALDVVESFLVRRMMVRATVKNYNRVFAQAVAELRKGARDEADTFLEGFFADQTADSAYWPDDAEITRELEHLQIYRRLRRPRLRFILEALEDRRRGFDVPGSKSKTEQRCPRGSLTIEHVIPFSWEANWPLGPQETDQSRRQLVHTLGNLTLLTSKLNSASSNRGWLGENGKKNSLKAHSLLKMSEDIIETGASAWTSTDVANRTRLLTQQITKIWSVPEGHAVNFQVTQSTSSLPKSSVYVADLIENGFIEPGAELRPTRSAHTSRRAKVLSDGSIEVDDGRVFNSPSGAAKWTTGAVAVAGWGFWKDMRSGKSLHELRNEYLAKFEIEEDDLEPDSE
jgi:hypothetical protein